jgi:hypothetical protein
VIWPAAFRVVLTASGPPNGCYMSARALRVRSRSFFGISVSSLDVQRAAHLQRMRELTEFKRQGGTLDVLLADHALYRLEADLRWIDHTAARLDKIARTVQGRS